MAGHKVLDWCRTEPIPKGLKDSARGFNPGYRSEKTIRPEGAVKRRCTQPGAKHYLGNG